MTHSVVQILLSLISAEVCGENISDEVKQELTEQVLEQIYNLSVSHDMAHIAASALQRAGALGNDEVSRKFSKHQMMAIFRCEKLNYELSCLTQALEDARIPFVPLKGSVIRKLYPEEWMRTSCDIDVLVQKSDFDAATKILIDKLEYRSEGQSSHDVSLYSQNNVHIELHYDLVEGDYASKAGQILASVWDYTTPEREGSYQRVMSDEMLYFYHIAHMAKHFEIGGCGIKPLMDTYVLKRHLNLDAQKLEKLLIDGKLLVFCQSSELLSDVWFCGADHTDLTLEMQNYIISGGVYGTTVNRVAVQQGKRGGKLGYVLSRVFIPYDTIKLYYPILQKHKWLLPAMYIRRGFDFIVRKGIKRGVRELRINNNINDEKSSDMQRFMRKVGL